MSKSSSAASPATVLDADATDLFGLTAALVAVPSESHHEAELADLVEARLRERAPSLTIDRVEHNVVVRTQLGRDRRVLLGGHLDTVPAVSARPTGRAGSRCCCASPKSCTRASFGMARLECTTT